MSHVRRQAQMDPVDEYARLKSEVRRLQDRLEVLRESFLKPGARLRSNQYEVQVRRQRRRVFLKDQLPVEILTDPSFWEERESEVVTCRPLGRWACEDQAVRQSESV